MTFFNVYSNDLHVIPSTKLGPITSKAKQNKSDQRKVAEDPEDELSRHSSIVGLLGPIGRFGFSDNSNTSRTGGPSTQLGLSLSTPHRDLRVLARMLGANILVFGSLF